MAGSGGGGPAGIGGGDKIPITAEVCLRGTSTAPKEEARAAVHRLLESRSLDYKDGPLHITTGEDAFIDSNVESITVCDTGNQERSGGMLLFWQISLNIIVYQLSEEDPAEEAEGDDEIAMCREWVLPARDFHGLWDSLIYDTGVKDRLLQFAASALLFSEAGVNTQLVSWNRVVLLHGPPGTGKTSLCKALAHKLAIRFGQRYDQGLLVEVNAHSLFSKWFSESGKMVAKLFAKIQEMVEESDTVVFILIDEVESLTSARKAAVSGSEPSDSIRVVNALLTHVDALKRHPNVMVLTTSNITEAIDEAFVDRADIKAYIGPPSLEARYGILRSCVLELIRAGVIVPRGEEDAPPQPYAEIKWRQGGGKGAGGGGAGGSSEPMLDDEPPVLPTSQALVAAAAVCEGLSGRTLRKLPFLAHANFVRVGTSTCAEYLEALRLAAERELEDKAAMPSAA